jgi:hypothetical protein
MHPRFELCLPWLPRPGVLPHAEEDFLRHIFRFSAIPEHAAGKTNHPRKMPAHEFSRRPLIAGADPANEFLVWIPHGFEANSERL